MVEISLGDVSQLPLYKRLVEQVKQLVATDRLQAGDRLPTVRQLASSLGVSPGTVVRAYMELEQEGVIQSRRGGGTSVSPRSADPHRSGLRQRHLSNIVSNNILEALSLGYSPAEIEAAFSLHLARRQEERKDRQEKSADRQTTSTGQKTLTIVASHDLALNMLVSQLKHRQPKVNVDLTYAGSLGGLIALQEERADLAGIHLLDEETGEYNYPYVRHILVDREVAIVHLAYRIQGLMFGTGNPKQIKGLEDLRSPDVRMINRQKGSGTRVLLDLKLRQQGIASSEVKGYEKEADSHLAVARGIAQGQADVGLGIEAAARACNVDFLPLFREKYDLVMPVEKYRSRVLSHLLRIVASEEFRKVVTEAGGYDTSQTGDTTFYRYSSN